MKTFIVSNDHVALGKFPQFPPGSMLNSCNDQLIGNVRRGPTGNSAKNESSFGKPPPSLMVLTHSLLDAQQEKTPGTMR